MPPTRRPPFQLTGRAIGLRGTTNLGIDGVEDGEVVHIFEEDTFEAKTREKTKSERYVAREGTRWPNNSRRFQNLSGRRSRSLEDGSDVEEDLVLFVRCASEKKGKER